VFQFLDKGTKKSGTEKMMFGEIICRMMVSLPLKQTDERKRGNAESKNPFGVSSFCNGV